MFQGLNGYCRKLYGKLASHNHGYHYYHNGKLNRLNSCDAVKKLKHLEKFNGKNMVNDAFEIYRNLHSTQQNEFVINALLNCCKKILKTKKGSDIEASIKVIDNIRDIVIETDYISAKNSLINVYGNYLKDINNALNVFDNIPSNKKDISSINSMMSVYNKSKQYHKSITLYEQFQDLEKNDVTFLLFIKACIDTNNHGKGLKLIESKIKDINSHSIAVINSVIDFYGKIGDINDAFKIFNNIPSNKKGDIASIGAMMNAYNNSKEYNKTIALYEQYNGKHDDVSNLLFMKACINSGNYDKGEKLANFNIKDINNHSTQFINTLVAFYGKSGDIQNASKVFNDIPHKEKNTVSISVMMTCFIDNNEDQNAISLYEQHNNVQHDDTSNLLFIKACSNIAAYDKGKKLITSITQDINKHSIEFINTLIDFYGKSGDISTALKIFNNIPGNKKNVVSINSMMTACINNEEYNQSISLYEQYNRKHNDTSNALFVKACSNIADYAEAKRLINLNIKDINNHSIDVINSVIDFYGKNGDIENALNIFDNVPEIKKDIVSINTMMTTYNNNKEYNKAILIYEQYYGEHNDISDTLYIKACINIGDYDKGKKLINVKLQDMRTRSVEFVTTVIDFYGKCGDINKAVNVFNNKPENKRNIVSINAMMTAYNNNEKYDECISLYEQYKHKHDDISNTLFIKACCNIGHYDKGKQLISSIRDINNRCIEFVTTSVDFYGKNGDIKNALKLFNDIPENKRDIAFICAMMNAFNNNEEYHEIISLYEQYNGEHSDASNLLFIKACSNIGDYNRNKKFMDSILQDITNHNIEFINTLINFYGETGDINTAFNIFENIPENKRNIASIGAMMNAYNKNEEYDKTISVFEQYDVEHNDISNTLFVNACGNIGEYDKGKELINSMNIRDINDHSIEFINTLINFYGETRDMDVALHIFNNVPKNNKTISSFGAIMNAYNNNAQYDKTINLFNEIKIEKNEYIYCMALFAAGNLVSTHHGAIIINDLNKIGNNDILQSLYVQSAMITYYAECDNFEKAITIFNNNADDINTHKNKNGVLYLYSAIMDCYAKRGNIQQLLSLFNNLKKDKNLNGLLSKHIYSIVLNGCSHSGLIDEAVSIFDEMDDKYKSDPKCIIPLIDCLGRKGHLTQAENLYNKYMQNHKNIHYKFKFNALGSLLSSCRIHNDVRFGQRMFDKMEAFNVELSDIAPMYAILSNIYGQNGEFDKVNEIGQIMKSKGIHSS